MKGPEFTPDEHLAHGRHNETFLRYLTDSVLTRRSEFADWALVVVFYAALHYTKAAILRDNGKFSKQHRSSTHDSGYTVGHNDLVREYLPEVVAEYMEMFDLGHDARYRSYFAEPTNGLAEVKRQVSSLRKVKEACGVAGGG